MIRALRALNAFAVYCEPGDTAIQVGMLVVDEEQFEPGVYTLVDVDKEDLGVLVGYPVEVPELPDNPAYQVSLKRCQQPLT